MSTYQDLFDDIALVIGGTKHAVPPPGFFSGAQANSGAGDGTGVPNLNGCFSQAPLAVNTPPPVGILLPAPFTANLMAQGYEENKDHVRLLILVAKLDLAVDLGILMPFRDTVPAALRAHMQVDQTTGATALTPEPLYVFSVGGKPGRVTWSGIDWWGWEFDIVVLRTPQVTYSNTP